MRVINVPTSTPYNVIIDRGLLKTAGEHIRQVTKASAAAVISDDKVFPLYGETLVKSLEAAGFTVYTHTFKNGESSKNLGTYGEILNFLAEKGLTRSDVLVALGGGVVGDVTGFAAATYLRGVNYVQVPTTLLAAVDSSVGGKTAVDLPVGKNLVGAFYQPRLVLCDPDTLKTLDEAVYRDGCAEIIKYGLLGDEDFFLSLDTTPVSEQPEAVIARCVEMKRDIVIKDEFDTGLRQLLNLGHTFGHGVEALSGYTMGHGTCVAIGMAVISKAAAKLGYCEESVPRRVESILIKYGLPTACPYSAEDIFNAALSDKKNYGGKIRLIVPFSVGDSRIVPVDVPELKTWLKAGEVL